MDEIVVMSEENMVGLLSEFSKESFTCIKGKELYIPEIPPVK